MIQKGKYRHYKGKEYEVIGIVRHSETLEELVIYRPLYEITDPKLRCDVWVRPLAMFFDEVEINDQKVLRFEYVEE